MTSRIRLASTKDAEQIRQIYSPYVENTVISFETAGPSAAEMEMRIRQVMDKHLWLVYEQEGEILGYAYASSHHERSAYSWAVDVSIYVKADRVGRGIGKSLYSPFFKLLKLQGFCNAYAIIALPNQASTALHEYFGFKPIGISSKVGYKFGKWIDVQWWEMHLNTHEAYPLFPCSIHQIDETRLVEAMKR
ncbi:Phosphinothricin acetyltransferase [Syntrophobotulus glycolicus DSM 8271]|uniref:Phosphinothricin acetyltransferase n=1 Tax=Syntrophobotulus glycolicus (strain DSM 8271 / FlGlyR) TaxID=645991 RepID=F0SXV1_SYNGF|nr:GNAT family N-acetyltransferase [Syntrophobotulus glycolicus]ADY57012.1 Phosphinothricin acetyltransferase [Syntrophobotulus glycolicus DSM 8271]